MRDSLSLDEKFVANIFKKYLNAKIILQKVAKEEFNTLQEKEILYGVLIDNQNQLIEYQNYLQMIETILALMPKSEYICLIKDFLNVEPNKLWWEKHYSKNDYQKLRHKAISRFLYLFLI